VFAFETTRQPIGLLPLLAGCSAAYLTMLLLMRHSIMTEKLARRGTTVSTDYRLDYLSQIPVRDVMSRELVTIRAEDPLSAVRAWLASGAGGATHQGFPVLDARSRLAGVVTRRDLLGSEPGDGTVRDVVKRNPAVIFEDNTLREAADHMVREGVGRLAVVARENTAHLIGVITRSDLLSAHARRLRHMDDTARVYATQAEAGVREE
jgi:CBS domain-containing protein